MRAFSSPSDHIFTLAPYMENIEHPRRFLFYSHDGLGPVRRNLAVANALLELAPNASIHVVTGAEDVEGLGPPPGIVIVKLPRICTTDTDESVFPPAGVRLLRERALTAAVEIFEPEVLLVDTNPFGLEGELGPALEIVRASGGRTALGLPDILDDPATVDLDWRHRGFFERIPDYFERVLVYGEPALLDPVADYFPPPVAELTSYCGYVVSSPPQKHRGGRPSARRARVLATAGSGDDGFPLLEAFVQAAAGTGWDATVIAGDQCPRREREMLRARAGQAGVAFRDFVPGLPSELASVSVLVCMGGYNTLADAAAAGVPTVCVPRAEPTKDQLLRARAFASRGLVRLVEPERLEPELLREEITAALAGRTIARPGPLDFGGDRRAARHLFELAAQRPSRPHLERYASERTLQRPVVTAS